MNNRTVTRKELLSQIAVVLTEEQYARAKAYLDKLSNFDFEQLIAEIKADASSGGGDLLTAKDYVNMQEKLQEMSGVNIKST